MENKTKPTLEELRKQLKDKKAKIFGNSNSDRYKNPLDKFTSIDELLRENIKAQRDLADITHKLLLAIYYKDGGEASITPTGVDTTAILKEITSRGNYKSLVKNFENDTISGSKTVFGIEATGILAECKFQSSTSTTDNKAYGVRIRSDKDVIYQDTWTNFEARNRYETDMTCYEDGINNYYILQFKNIAFVESLKIEVYESSASFTNIYIKYHKEV